MKFRALAISSLVLMSSPITVLAQETVNGVTQQRGFLGQKVSPTEMQVIYGGTFKGAHRIAITAFNVAFPNENHLVAKTSGHGFGLVSSAKADLRTTMTGVDQATRQRIADQAYKTFVAQLTAAGYEVVDTAELSRLAPEYAKWAPEPNFSLGRFGTYVAPSGRSLYWLKGDRMKRNADGKFDETMSFMQMVTDQPQAYARSMFVAHDADVGVVAITLVVDYGVYSTSGISKRSFGGRASASFLPGVSVAAGSGVNTSTTLSYWKPKTFGVPATATLQIPIRSDAAFIVNRSNEGAVDAAIVADPKKFEAAANEVINQALPKFVSVMTANR
jgi:hypothetical protein